jgi:flavodoxin
MEANAQNQSGARKMLVAYFSWGGNTRTIAKMIFQTVGGAIFEIKTVNMYPKEYRLVTDIATQEQKANARPALMASVNDMDSYDTVFLGYPNWWESIPMAIFTFLESYDFTGKTIIPFCTHEGSALSQTVATIKRLCPGATVRDGLAIRGGKVNRAQIDVQNWLRSLGTVK